MSASRSEIKLARYMIFSRFLLITPAHGGETRSGARLNFILVCEATRIEFNTASRGPCEGPERTTNNFTWR